MTQPETITFGAVGDIAFYDAVGEEMLAHGVARPKSPEDARTETACEMVKGTV